MTEEDVRLKLQDIFRRIFDDDTIEISSSTTADDIEEWDSLNQIKIILAAEQEFGKSLNARKISTFDDVGDMIRYLHQIVNGNEG